jgi:GDP-mannose 6-dehydrogenase
MASISIFGLGYVGTVSVACLAAHGHRVVGVDVNALKVSTIKSGRSPIVEASVQELLSSGVADGRIEATNDAAAAVRDTDVSIVSVGTPGSANGSLNVGYVERVCQDIGRAIADKETPHLVVVRSTMLPGTTEELVIPTLAAASGKSVGSGFDVVFHPEFLREGSSVIDFNEPPVTVMAGTSEAAISAAAQLYPPSGAPFFSVPFRVAELLKYANNAFHGLKVTFANEIGNLCKQQGIDGHLVMDLLCQDTKLNLSPYYLKPGFAFGGSCLPKDLRALLYFSRNFDLSLPVLESILPSNRHQVDVAYQMVRRTGRKRVGVFGMSFKPGTDDLRESPMVELIEYLHGKGYDVRVYDRDVSLSNLQGANREYIEQQLPHVASMLSDSFDDVLEHAEVAVVGHRSAEFAAVLDRLRDDQVLIDLARLAPAVPDRANYEGICW